MKFKFLRDNYRIIISSLITISVSSLGLLNLFTSDNTSDSFVEDMMEVLEEEERLDEIAMRRTNYPPSANTEQKGYIDQILKFERDNGLCSIMFISNEKEGSHYRVEDVFGIGEGKFGERNILKEFVGIISSDKVANACRSVGIDGKVFIKNNGRNEGHYFLEDQAKESFKKGVPPST